ncbi:MAG: nuclear transport factor 2 family protein [Myxococcota bacterium]
MGTLDEVVIHVDTGSRGAPAEFVARFAELWANPRAHADPFGELLSPEVRLIAPMTPTTRDRVSGMRALQNVFNAAPDLRADVLNWSLAVDVLFIEMRFAATIGGRKVSWHNVDRFRFAEGVAVERIAYFDPSVLQRALLRNPRGWLQLAKLLLRRG